VYANYYPPTNPEYQPNTDELPPLIAICHGGPTAQSSIALDPRKQFWTSRGFALLDVNYSGSTGYGREYRSRLNKKWGELDVDDCCDAALYAVSEGLADRERLIIRGSSAGGFTVLCALTFAQVFSAGASYYGISELTSLASDTHKFESRYLDHLIGPYPETRPLYQRRSPINHTERLNCPVIFFQGVEDRVVPKEQAEGMFHALSKKGLPVAAQYFAGEQHGFRKAETIITSLENELNFYRLVFKLTPRDEISFIGDILLGNIS
jgi:dipeptidyl aminopeptidase/acylaminoacyl peptidase